MLICIHYDNFNNLPHLSPLEFINLPHLSPLEFINLPHLSPLEFINLPHLSHMELLCYISTMFHRFFNDYSILS
jgi:hypothetical protein